MDKFLRVIRFAVPIIIAIFLTVLILNTLSATFMEKFEYREYSYYSSEAMIERKAEIYPAYDPVFAYCTQNFFLFMASYTIAIFVAMTFVAFLISLPIVKLVVNFRKKREKARGAA